MNCIAAVSSEWGLGKDNQLLFHIPEDMKRFRRLTTGGTLILGRKTLESFPGGRPLPDRRHLVLSRQTDYQPEGVEVFHSAAEILETVRHLPEEHVWVSGGGEIYRAFLPYCKTAYITFVHASPEADTFFPDLTGASGWELTRSDELSCFESAGEQLFFRFCEYTNLKPKQIY